MTTQENNSWLKTLAFWTFQSAGQRATQRAIHAGVDAALMPVTSVAGVAREVTESALSTAVWWTGSLIITGAFNGICYLGETVLSSTLYAFRSAQPKEQTPPTTPMTPF